MMHRNRHVFDIRRLEFDQQQERTLVFTGLVISFLILLWRQHGFWVAALGCGGGLAFTLLIFITVVYIRSGTFPRGRMWDYQSMCRKSLRPCEHCNCGLGAAKKDKLSDDEAGEADEADEAGASDASDASDASEEGADSEEEKAGREEKSRFQAAGEQACRNRD